MPSASQFQTKRNFALPLPGCILWQSGAHIQDLAVVNHSLCHLCILFLLDATLLTWTLYCQLQDDKMFPTFQEWLLCPPVLRKSGSRQMPLTAVLSKLTYKHAEKCWCKQKLPLKVERRPLLIYSVFKDTATLERHSYCSITVAAPLSFTKQSLGSGNKHHSPIHLSTFPKWKLWVIKNKGVLEYLFQD